MPDLMHPFLRPLPTAIEALAELTLDLRWTWSHAADRLWQALDPDIWAHTQNPWLMLQSASQRRLETLAQDAGFLSELHRLLQQRAAYLSSDTWFSTLPQTDPPPLIAYFSMEYGLAEALPLYSGGLGVLAGDHLKAASDLGVPLVAVGLLYQEGYFRQMLDASGRQREIYTQNLPTSMPVTPVRAADGAWLGVPIALPGRTVTLRVWRAQVGRVNLYLLDSNDPMNSPADRGITAKLYDGGNEMRLAQEIVLGIGGWRTLLALGLDVDVCHLNEGHAAGVTLERARHYMQQQQVDFWQALWATRAGNVFTTHTPVSAAFDTFPPELLAVYARDYAQELGISLAQLLALGRRPGNVDSEPFNMAYLAMHTCSQVNGVSRLHGVVSRRIFSELYPRWPEHEVPVAHITNGVHVPSWDSPWSDHLWTEACGKERWRSTLESPAEGIGRVTDAALWTLCGEERADLVHYARQRHMRQLGQRGADAQAVAAAQAALDPNALTLGYARRFTEYKRPTLLLHDPDRLARLLTRRDRPVQLIVAGKAHPQDQQGRQYVQAWANFVRRADVRPHAVFLEDYDISLAQQLVQGVDVWINTPRRPWEACGTSGMKVLANGGLNLSTLDGWWAEAYRPEVGWALGDGGERTDAASDAEEAQQLYSLLENEIVPQFYDRNSAGLPTAWVARMRASMGSLAPQFSSTSMLSRYVETVYLPAAQRFRKRRGAAAARALYAWATALQQHWDSIHIGPPEARREGAAWQFDVQVYLGELAPDMVAVQLYAKPAEDGKGVCHTMDMGDPLAGAAHGYRYRASVPSDRPAQDYTVRVVAHQPEVCLPQELPLILWQH
jgi:glycogen phosphorylase